MVNLEKIIEPDSLRGIGLRPSGIAPHCLPIAGMSRGAILSTLQCESFTIRRIPAENAFVVSESHSIYYLYVRPKYPGYRRVASLRFGGIPSQHDVDHILAKNLAIKFGYNFVLLGLVRSRINRLHGYYEQFYKSLAATEDVPEVCFANARIFDKALGRNTKIRRPFIDLRQGYNPHERIDYGLTLKQRGVWNLTFGFDRPVPEEFVRRLKPL